MWFVLNSKVFKIEFLGGKLKKGFRWEIGNLRLDRFLGFEGE